MVEIALGTALAAIGAGVAIGFAGLGSGIGQGMSAASAVLHKERQTGLCCSFQIQ